MIARPCIECGSVIAAGSRCAEHKLPAKPPKHRVGRTATDWRWRKLSQRLRRASPFCEMPGCPSIDLTVDHVIPLVDAPELVYEELNLRVICRGHNAQRGVNCSDDERAAVYAAIKARTERRARAYQHNG